LNVAALKGVGFSPASEKNPNGALAPEGMLPPLQEHIATASETMANRKQPEDSGKQKDE
jgi:hypothetical protein